MPTKQKINIVSDISEKFEKAKGIYLTDFLGLNVSEMTELRKQFFEKGVQYRVVKNTLVKLAAKNAGYDNLGEYLNGSTAIAFSYDDPTIPAQIIKKFAASHNLPKLKAFIFESQLMDESKFNLVANLPSRDVLLSQLINGLASPMSKLVATMKSPILNLMSVLNRLKKQKQS